MKTLLTLCVLLLATATANAQFDLLEQPAAQATPSAFDLLHQADAPAASSPAASPAETGFDLLFVANTACNCGCGKPNCDCQTIAAEYESQISNLKSQIPKPIVYMRSASWCVACRLAKKQITEADDCPFELRIIPDEDSATALPRFTWQADGKWFVPIDPQSRDERSGFYGVADLIAHWQHTQPKGASGEERGASLPSLAPRPSSLATSIERHFVARMQSPPVGLSKPTDSPKKSSANSSAGSNTNAAASAVKSLPPSSPNTARPSASTPSPGGRS